MAQDDFGWICPVVIELVIQITIEIYVSREKTQDSIKKKLNWHWNHLASPPTPPYMYLCMYIKIFPFEVEHFLFEWFFDISFYFGAIYFSFVCPTQSFCCFNIYRSDQEVSKYLLNLLVLFTIEEEKISQAQHAYTDFS